MTFKRFVNGFEVVAVVIALVAVFLLFVNEPTSGSAGRSSPGAAIFAASCASCHGADGGGSIGPKLAGTVTEEYPDVDDEIAVVTEGRAGMPSFGGDLSERQIQQVVDYTRTELGG
jgi:mono/diheme cytochrome c family protein